MRTLTILLSLLLILNLAQAQTVRYVSDTLETPLRTGASTRHKIIRMLASGNALQVLQTDAQTGYTLVRTEAGTRGWILTRDLMDTPGTREQLAKAEQTLASLQAENADLKERLAALLQVSKRDDGGINFEELSQENQRLSQQLAHVRKVAVNAVAIDEQNKTLQERVVMLERELQIVQQENQVLSDRSTRDWFLVGAGVLLLGVIVGVLLPRLRWHRGNRWGEL